MPTLQSNVQAEINTLRQQSGYIELFTLDASRFGGVVYHFTNTPSSTGAGIAFNGITYQPIPIEATGFDITSSGTLPKPHLIIGNVSKTLLSAVLSLGDLVGAKLTRIRTYEKFLDAGSSPNGSAYIGPEVWLVEQMTQRTASSIQWSLTTTIDRLAFHAGRQVLKDQSVKNLYAPGVSRTRTQ